MSKKSEKHTHDKTRCCDCCGGHCCCQCPRTGDPETSDIKNILPEVLFTIDNQVEILRIIAKQESLCKGLGLTAHDLALIDQVSLRVDMLVNEYNKRNGKKHICTLGQSRE